jgi:hypothetical protein
MAFDDGQLIWWTPFATETVDDLFLAYRMWLKKEGGICGRDLLQTSLAAAQNLRVCGGAVVRPTKIAENEGWIGRGHWIGFMLGNSY